VGVFVPDCLDTMLLNKLIWITPISSGKSMRVTPAYGRLPPKPELDIAFRQSGRIAPLMSR